MRSPQFTSGAIAAVLLLTLPALAGCLDVGLEPADADLEDAASLTPWERGLEDHHPTPDAVERRSREDRRADLAPPGDPLFAEFDAAFQAFMEAHGIPAGQVAIMHEGKLRYTRGYGHADEAATTPTDTDTMFRVASITKPMTAAVVALQVEEGLYNWTDPVFCVPPEPAPGCRLAIAPHPAFPVVDERIRDVTVRHLVDHTGGWGRTMDPILFAPANVYDHDDTITIAEKMGIPSPPPAWRLGQYLMGQRLADDPGEVFAYCNVCYLLAGLVAESASGATIDALYDAYLFRPLEVEGDIEVGRTLPEERNPRETFYPCEPFYDPADKHTANVFAPDEEACWPDGGWSMGTIAALGGITSTASAVAAVYEVYGLYGRELMSAGPVTHSGHGGSLPATATVTGIIEDGDAAVGKVQYVALFNKVGVEEPYWPYANTYWFEPPLAALAAAWGASENVQ